MNIELNGPVTITLSAQTMATVLDVLAAHLPYSMGKAILENEIFPQLAKKEPEGDDR